MIGAQEELSTLQKERKSDVLVSTIDKCEEMQKENLRLISLNAKLSLQNMILKKKLENINVASSHK